ncbi:hypothetical protein BMS3Bbin04_02110 [bacterium BMS3Bbin04]|nr:hypothetical protein BMS3Bbin04_02110 [bacterium BMS3Bbin04]
MITDRDYQIQILTVDKFIDRFGSRTVQRNAKFGHHCNRVRIDARGIHTCGKGVPRIPQFRVNQVFRHNAASRITGAEDQNIFH